MHQPSRQPNPEFSRRFKEVMSRESSQFAMARRIGCTQSYVGQIARGQARPGRELVERFIEAYELDRAEWLELAGFGEEPPPEDERVEIARRAAEEALRLAGFIRAPEDSGHDVFWREFGLWVQECQEQGLPLPATPRLSGGTRSLTPDEARSQLRILRELHERSASG